MWLLYTLDHAMPPCSTNRNVTQLFRKNMPPILKPGTHNQTFEPHQSLMRPFVLSLGTRDEKRQKTERKKMSPLLPVIQGFDFASLCFITRWRSTEREDKRQKGKREKTEWEQCGHARCLLVYHSSLSSLRQLIQQQKDSFPLNQGSDKTHTPLTWTSQNTCLQKDHFPSSCILPYLPLCLLQVQGNILQKHPYSDSTKCLIPEWCDWLNQTALFIIIPEIDSCLCLCTEWTYFSSLWIYQDSTELPPLFLRYSTFPLSCSSTQLLSHPALLYPSISFHIYILGSVPSSVIKKPLS